MPVRISIVIRMAEVVIRLPQVRLAPEEALIELNDDTVIL